MTGTRTLTFREFVETLVDLCNNHPDFQDAQCMVAGDGTFALATKECVAFRDVPEHEEEIRSKWNHEKNAWDVARQKVPAHKVVVVSAPASASYI